MKTKLINALHTLMAMAVWGGIGALLAWRG